jgi:transcription elongation factor Elf1
MEPQIVETRIGCPYCAQAMEVVLDLSGGSQSYVEDCQICCQPMQISFDVDNDRLQGLQVDRA